MGERALLVEVDALDEVLALHRRLAASAPEGLIELVPAARTVLVTFDPRRLGAAAVRSWVHEAADAQAATDAASAFVELDIVYDGPDLDETAGLLGISPEALIAAHQEARWTVAFTGFAPGFGYLVSEDWPYQVPRLASPRTRVPGGSVGLAGEFSGAYPRETPGGWRLIGTTNAPLFDPDASSPALLTPGARVRFVAKARPLSPSKIRGGIPERGEGSHTDRVPEGSGIRVLEPGLLATIQDLGRPGHSSLGIAGSGALDRTALRAANRLLGNLEGAAGIEITMGGFRALAERDCWFALAGGWGQALLDGRSVDAYTAHPWRAGAELHVDWLSRGARVYLAIRGGVLAPILLGSSATDLLSRLGPDPLAAGEGIRIGPAPHAEIPGIETALWGAPPEGVLDVRLANGPRADWFSPEAQRVLFEAEWTVSNQSDRIGIRLDGPELARIRPDELPSEPMVPGALQVPPSGRPVILGADGPVTGGYPVIAVASSLDAFAQARPGTRIRFRHARP